MAKLEDLKPGLQVEGIIPHQNVTIIDVKWHGSAAIAKEIGDKIRKEAEKIIAITSS